MRHPITTKILGQDNDINYVVHYSKDVLNSFSENEQINMLGCAGFVVPVRFKAPSDNMEQVNVAMFQ